MASVACCENFEGIRVSEIDSSNFLIMALMGELQDHVEESDEERLNSMIQSLEAEINSTSVIESISDGEYSDQSWSTLDQQMDGCDYSISFDDLDMNEWVDMEAMPSSPISHDLDWYSYPCGDEILSIALDDQERGYYI